jgi:hypothetical protein
MNISRHPLQPDETIHKILISTTSRMTGEFISDDILISHAWQNFTNSSGAIRREENPVSRSGFIVAFRTEPYKKEAGVAVPDYSPVGEIVCSYLSVLFGKRFDCHGLVEGSGFYNTPDLTAYNSICDPKLPFNTHKQRSCFKVPLDLYNFSTFAKIFTDPNIDPSFQTKLNASCKFYMQALQNVEYDPEVAYLHLITSGEILAGFFKYEKEELLDQQILDSLSIIQSRLEDGENIARQISGQLLGIKRRFVKSLCSLINHSFFESNESDMKFGYFKPELIEKNIGSAYDLRSKYVHTGVPFGSWIQPRGHYTDLQLGRPVVIDREFSKTLEKAPTFLGLERFIRYCLLSFMALNGFSEILEFRDNT